MGGGLANLVPTFTSLVFLNLIFILTKGELISSCEGRPHQTSTVIVATWGDVYKTVPD